MPMEHMRQQESFGCLYVRAGKERKTVDLLRRLHPEISAFSISQMKHQSQKGVKTVTDAILLPGYVLFQADTEFEVQQFYRLESVVRLLKYEDRSWMLRGDDLAFARWIFRMNGVIGLSRAYREGTMVRITEGPLKDFAGKILRVDSRNRNAQVSFGFDQQVFTAWLAFEWMEEEEKRRFLHPGENEDE